MNLPSIPVRDYREGGLLAYASDHARQAGRLMDAVLDGMGVGGRVLRPLLPLGDRLAQHHLTRTRDPYRAEVFAIRERLDRPGPIAFALSYEFGCTARGFEESGRLFRTLDWPFRGLGGLVEVVRLHGPAGDWVTATWPGLTGVLHGTAPGRFAIALNQAPERRAGLGRVGAWAAGKLRFWRSDGLLPPHLLRQVFELAPDFETAQRMLSETPVAVPVIYSIIGPNGQAATIERDQTEAVRHTGALAANHFAGRLQGRWRPRGYDSRGRLAAANMLGHAPDLAALTPPILNPLTRLAMTLDLEGGLVVAGFEGDQRLTKVTDIPPLHRPVTP